MPRNPKMVRVSLVENIVLSRLTTSQSHHFHGVNRVLTDPQPEGVLSCN